MTGEERKLAVARAWYAQATTDQEREQLAQVWGDDIRTNHGGN